MEYQMKHGPFFHHYLNDKFKIIMKLNLLIFKLNIDFKNKIIS